MTAGNLSGHPTVSSGYHSYNAEHNGKAKEKISGDIAQIQKAAARYSYCTYDSYDRQHSHNNACNFANGLFHGDPPYHFRAIDCNFILLSQNDFVSHLHLGKSRGELKHRFGAHFSLGLDIADHRHSVFSCANVLFPFYHIIKASQIGSNLAFAKALPIYEVFGPASMHLAPH